MDAQDAGTRTTERNQIQIDKHFGKLSVLNGEVYYSPNSSRPVQLPAPREDVYGKHISIFSMRDPRLQWYHQPRWWTQTFGWVSFVPLSPSYTGALFRRLSHVPTVLDSYAKDDSETDLLYAIPKPTRDSWRRLDTNLCLLTSLIAKQYKLATSRPFSPWALGYDTPRLGHKGTVRRAFLSRDWFSMWMGLASYLIAQAESLPPKPNNPTWPQLLLQHGFQQTFIDALKSSTVCDFSHVTQRAGAFVYLGRSPIPQPPVEWFTSWNIPVWYKWGLNERNDRSCAPYAPTPYQLQELLLSNGIERPLSENEAFRSNSSSDNAHRSSAESPVIPQRATPAVRGTPREREYVAFFAAREARNEDRRRKETAKDRQARLNRERCPPTVSAKVFVWEPSATDPEKWVRAPVPRWAREDTLGEYSAAQRRYDSFSNEWDCCDAFGSGHDDDDDDDGIIYFNRGSVADDPSQWPEPPAVEVPRSITPPPQPAQVSDAERLDLPRFHPIAINRHEESLIQPIPVEADLWQQEVLEILFLHYGYTPPLPLPSSSPPLSNEADRKKLIRLLGLSWSQSQTHISERPIAGLAKSYLDIIISGTRPADDTCDLNDRNRLSLRSSLRLKCLRFVKTTDSKAKGLYMFDFGRASSASWKLTLTTAADALMVCRLDAQLNEYEIARFLLDRGIPFRTMLPLELASQAPQESPPPCVLPVRLSDSVFTRSDYDAYAKQRFDITGQPRARAALLRGTIIWRLCVATVSFEEVLQGPTGWNPMPGAMFTVQDPRTKEVFIDDNLTDVELSLLSGTYTCYTGIRNQTATKSWYPLASTFEAGGEDYGRWNTYREDGYLMRVDEINNPGRPEGSRGPLTAGKWRDLTRGMKEMRRLKDNIERWSEDFLKQHIEHF